MRLFFKSREQKLADLLAYVPEGDFIAVFGTSHTSGVCKRGDSERIEPDLIWPTLVAEHYGLPVFNASNPGNDNETIVQQMLDFLDLPGVTERCKYIICELRVNEGAFRIGRDIVGEFRPYRRFDWDPQLKNCFAVGPKEVKDSDGGVVGHHTIADKMLYRTTSNFFKMPMDKQRSMIRDIMPDADGMMPDGAFDVISQAVETFNLTENVTMAPFIHDYNHIRTMSKLCRLAGIPFKWFCWDKHSEVDGPSDEYKCVKAAYTQVTDVFETEVSTLVNSATGLFEKGLPRGETIEAYKCDCGHETEPVHKFVSERIIKAIGPKL